MSDTTTTALDRQVGGNPFPAAGTYVIDQSHSTVQAVARHLMVSKVRGGFNSFSGTIVVAEEPAASSVEVSIDAASIDTRDEQRDGHLRSPDFLDVETHPQLTFTSTQVDPSGRVTGDLTIRGITRPVTLDVEYLGTFKNPFGQTVAAFTGTTKIDRTEWEMTWNAPLEAGGVLVGKELTIELEVQAALQETE
ncbi:YceI family protein [Euzebya sp.]|uniref:YceI family protein n=1 Tax=Euzebya sp. TaxID=1971409 RepID=UPI00351355DE